MKNKKNIIIFTDLDGSLLDNKTFKFDVIKDYIKKLISSGVIIIPNSSKTEAELLDFNRKSKLNLCFISENGSSIHGLNLINKNFPSKISISRPVNEIYKIYNDNISLDLKKKITLILKLEKKKQEKIFGLKFDQLLLATKRMHSIPILFEGTEIEKNILIENINNMGLSVQTGGRIMNICDNTNKANAMSKALQIIKEEFDKELVTIGVGDNENDIEMLKQADYPCLVKNDNFDSSTLNIDNLIKSTKLSPMGWSDVIKTALQKI